MIIIDVWEDSGPGAGGDHVARFVRPTEEALRLITKEMRHGFHINCRMEDAPADFSEHDNRILELAS